MTERTQLSQEDEALRQARTDTAIRDGLRTIADRLANKHPGGLVTPAQRQALALTIASIAHPDDDDAAVEYERQLLRRMPFVEGKAVTRGEYALWLHKNSWSAR